MKRIVTDEPVQKNYKLTNTKDLVSINKLLTIYTCSTITQSSKLLSDCIRDSQCLHLDEVYAQNVNLIPSSVLKKVIVNIPKTSVTNYRHLLTSAIIHRNNLSKIYSNYSQTCNSLQCVGKNGTIPYCTDLNKFATYFKIIYIIVNILLKNAAYGMAGISEEFISTKIIVDWKTVERYLNAELEVYRPVFPPISVARLIYNKNAVIDWCTHAEHQEHKSVCIPIQLQCVNLCNLTVCKYASIPDILLKGVINALAISYHTNQDHSYISPNVNLGQWYFKNIMQGYYMSVILKNVDVNILNVMRKLYFVIITSDAPVMSIEVHFKFRNEMYSMVYYNYIPSGFPFDTLHWSYHHLHALTTCIRCGSLPYLLNAYGNPMLIKSVQVLAAITCSELDSNSYNQDVTSCTNDNDEQEASCPDYYTTSDDSGLSVSTSCSADNITSGHKNCTLMRLFLAVEHLLGNKKNATAGKTLQGYLYNDILASNIVACSKLWLTNIINDAMNVGETLNDEVDETLFDNIYSFRHQYIQMLNKFTSHVFCKPFLKCLGYSLMQYLLIL